MKRATFRLGNDFSGLRHLGWAALWLSVAASAGLAGCGSDSKGNGNTPAGTTGGASGAADQAGSGNAQGGVSEPGTGQAGASQGGAAMTPSLDGLLDAMGGPAPKADWTVFVYGHGDHNLSASLVADIAEMKAATLQAAGKVNLIVLADWDASQIIDDSAPPQHYPSGAQLLRVPGGGKDTQLIAYDEQELDLDDPRQLQRVLSIAFAAFPSERRGLVLWDHGGSWSGGFGHDSQNGTRPDSPGIPVKSIPGPILAGLKAAGVESEPPLDFFAFDTCLMGAAEVLYPLRQLAPVYTANAELDYGDGWDYTGSMSYLAQNPSATSTEFGSREVAIWDKHHASSGASDATLRAHISVDTSHVDALASAMSTLSNAMLTTPGFNIADLARIAYDSSPAYLNDFELNDFEADKGLQDLGQVLDGLVASELVPAPIVAAAQQARTALQDMTLATSLGSLRAARKQSGLHFQLGRANDLTPEKLTSYASLASDWANVSGWKKVLDLLASSADQTPPDSTQSVSHAADAGPGQLPVLTFSSPDSDVQSASVQLVVPNQDGTITYRGFLGGGLVEPKADYEFDWDGKAIAVGGAPAMLLPYIELGSDLDNTVYQVLGVINDGQNDSEAALVFSGTDQVATNYIATFGEQHTVATLADVVAANPKATFTPRLLKFDPKTKASELVSGTAVPIPANGELPIATEPVAAGNYALVVDVYDVWGNRSTVSSGVKLVTPVTP